MTHRGHNAARAPRIAPSGLVAREARRLIETDAPAKLLGREGPIRSAGISGRDAGPPGLGPTPDGWHEPGGALVNELLHPAFTVFDRLAMFSPNISPRRPVQFTMGAYVVPQGQTLWLSDYHFGVLLFDGVNPGDNRLAEEGRFRGVLGFDLKVMDRRMGDIAYQLDPVPRQTTRQQFEEVVIETDHGSTTDKFFRTQASSFAAVSGQGEALLPVTNAVQGPRGKPWTWIVDEGSSVAVKCVIFRPIRTPIAGVFAKIAGHLIHVNTSKALENRLRPR